MSSVARFVQVRVDATHPHQTIDGFGVNINARCWAGGTLAPTLDLLIDDLGATLYRVDIWGTSNWADPDGGIGPAALEADHLSTIYQGAVFQDGWGMLRHLNARGIAPYLTCSGMVPRWMCGPDGATLVDYTHFAELLVSMLRWARQQEGLQFHLFGPLNETDLGPPEGPRLDPAGYVAALNALEDALQAAGLDDLRLVVSEQSGMGPEYVQAILADERIAERVGVWSMHCYSEIAPAQYAAIRTLTQSAHAANARLWMTEYGDLDQSGEKEWSVAWIMTSRLFDLIEGGFEGALVWDAFDNYHDHDQAWTIYGLLRTGLRAHTPKLRYYASKQIFRFVRPGFVRIDASSTATDLRVLAFTSPDRNDLTIVGMNSSLRPLNLNIRLAGFPSERQNGHVTYFRTSEQERCHTIGKIAMRGRNWPYDGIDVLVPPESIVTLTTVE